MDCANIVEGKRKRKKDAPCLPTGAGVGKENVTYATLGGHDSKLPSNDSSGSRSNYTTPSGKVDSPFTQPGRGNDEDWKYWTPNGSTGNDRGHHSQDSDATLVINPGPNGVPFAEEFDGHMLIAEEFGDMMNASDQGTLGKRVAKAIIDSVCWEGINAKIQRHVNKIMYEQVFGTYDVDNDESVEDKRVRAARHSLADTADLLIL